MTRAVLIVLGILCLIGLICGAGAATISKIHSLVEDARKSAYAERDAYWQGQIAKSNAEAEAKLAAAIKQTASAEEAARDQLEADQARADNLEKQNAALPDDGACGLSADSVRLLNNR